MQAKKKAKKTRRLKLNLDFIIYIFRFLEEIINKSNPNKKDVSEIIGTKQHHDIAQQKTNYKTRAKATDRH
jgi:hypothetical protein